METVSDFFFWGGGSKITADGDCSHESKRCLLLGRKVMTNLDSIFKSRDITLPTKVRLVKAMVFSSSHIWMWELDCEESWALKNWCLPGVSVRNSTRGKGHEVGGLTYAKVGSSLRSPPGNSRASTPQTRVCLLYCFVRSPTPLTLRGAVPHHRLSLWERVNLQLQLIKFLGMTRVF